MEIMKTSQLLPIMMKKIWEWDIINNESLRRLFKYRISTVQV